MLGKREDLKLNDNNSKVGEDWREELERIHQLYQKRRPWTSNFKTFVEKQLGIQIGQGVVDSKLDRKFRVEAKYTELLDIFNKKQARLASEVVGEDSNFSQSNSKLDATNTSTAVGDSQPGFFITPDKLQEQMGHSQYEKLLAETFATLNTESKPQPPSATASPKRRNEQTEQATQEAATDLHLEIPTEDKDGHSESEMPMADSGSEELATLPMPGAAELTAHMNGFASDQEQPKLHRLDSFDLLTDTDLEGFLFQKEDYSRLISPSRTSTPTTRARRLQCLVPLIRLLRSNCF